MDSYDVWDIKKIADNGSGGRHRVRWAVDGREHCKSFRSKTLADGFLDGLKDAARRHRPSAPAPGCRPSGRPGARWSPGTSTRTATPRRSGRAWPRSRAGRSASLWSPSPSPSPPRNEARPSRRCCGSAVRLGVQPTPVLQEVVRPGKTHAEGFRLPVDEARRDGGEVSRRAAEQVPAAVGALQVSMSLVFPGDTDGAVQLDHLARCLGQCL